MSNILTRTKFLTELVSAARTAAVYSAPAASAFAMPPAGASIECIVSVGTIPSNGTLDCKVQESANADGSSATDITDAAIVQRTASNHETTLHLEVPMTASRKRYGKVLLTVANQTIPCSLAVVERNARGKEQTVSGDFKVADVLSA